ncbi:MAG: RING finger domain-containing protein [Flammeovirgaceae bacterium]
MAERCFTLDQLQYTVKKDGGLDDCPICLEGYKEEKAEVLLLECRHIFHRECGI